RAACATWAKSRESNRTKQARLRPGRGVWGRGFITSRTLRAVHEAGNRAKMLIMAFRPPWACAPERSSVVAAKRRPPFLLTASASRNPGPMIFPQHSANPCPRRRRRHGFALLITIVLVAFLVLVLVTLASLTRVETTVATNSRHVAEARDNALVALNIALGQLQRFAGPDRRATATAGLGDAAEN